MVVWNQASCQLGPQSALSAGGRLCQARGSEALEKLIHSTSLTFELEQKSDWPYFLPLTVFSGHSGA